MFDETDFFVINNLIKGTPNEVIARGLTDGDLALRNRIRKYEELGFYFCPGISAKVSKAELQIFNYLLRDVQIELISKYLNLSEESVKRARTKFYRIKMQSALQSDYTMSKNEIDISNLYSEGMNVSEIVRKLGLNRRFVSDTVERLKSMKLVSPKGNDVLDKIIQYREEGYGEKEIAKRLGFTENQIFYLIQKMKSQGINVPKRKKGVSLTSESRDLDKKIAVLLVHHSQSDIARMLNISRQAVSVRVKKIKNEGIDGEKLLRDSVIEYIQKEKTTPEQFEQIVKKIKDIYMIDVSDLVYLTRNNSDYGMIER